MQQTPTTCFFGGGGSSVAVEPPVGVFRGLKLPAGLRHDPAPRGTIDCHNGPSLAVLVA
jgi:hypothetical protein